MQERAQTPPVVILLVEDSDEDYAAFMRALQGDTDTVSVQRCTGGKAAIKYLHRQGCFAVPGRAPYPALVLLDLNLPGMDGRELLAALKADAHLQAIPVVIMTTSHDPRDIEWTAQHGASGYHIKAIDYTQFRDEIRQLIASCLGSHLLPPSWH